MFKDIFGAFGQQFPHWRNRSLLIALMVLMALVPVAELLVFQIFSTLLVEGTGKFAGQTGVVIGLLAVFFLGFAITRGLHHVTKFWRVRLFRGAFADLQERTGVGAASWQWAQAFGVSTAIADIIQIVAILALLFFLDLAVGAVGAVLTVLVLVQISALYRRQLRVQRELMESTVKSIEAPIRERVFSGEFAALAASAASGIALALVAWRTFGGGLAIATAIVLAMALRIYFGKVAGLAPTFMRFARDSLRFERDLGRHTSKYPGAAAVSTGDDDDTDGDGATDGTSRPPGGSRPEPPLTQHQRSKLVGKLLIEAQRGERAEVSQASAALRSGGRLTVKERDAILGAEAFLALATADATTDQGAAPVGMFWWPRPLPGPFDEWLNPFVIREAKRRPVRFVPLTGTGEAPAHLILGGSLAEYANASSIVAGAGVQSADARVNPEADFVFLRGPLTAQAVRGSGGPLIDSFGDPRLLLSRLHRVQLEKTNGRLAFVRGPADSGTPFHLPDGMHEYSITGPMPEQVIAAINTLAWYDGVVTTSLGVMAVCHSYGVPSALIVHERSPRVDGLEAEFRDYVVGAGLEQDWHVHPVRRDLTAIDWTSRLIAEQVSMAKLEEIDAGIDAAIQRYSVAVSEELERAIGEPQEEDD